MAYSNLLGEIFPTDYTPQDGQYYKLERRDYLSMYAFLTPQQIIDTFGAWRCVSLKTIYRGYHARNLSRPLEAKKYLKWAVASAVPQDYTFDEWNDVSYELIQMAQAEATAKIWKSIYWHEKSTGAID